MSRKLTGIRRRGKGWAVLVRVKGHLHQTTFPLDTPLWEMKDWRAKQVDAFGGDRHSAGTFAADIETYLARPEIAAQAYVRKKRAHLVLWRQAVGGDRPRSSITRDELEAVIQRWLSAGLSEPTVYHRRSSLQSLYVTLDEGTNRPNVVRQTTCPSAWHAHDRSIPYETVERIIAAMTEQRYIKKGIPRQAIAKLYATVIAHTGIRPVDLRRIRAADLDLEAGTVRMPRSHKGAGVASWTLPLSAQGLAAFRAFHAAQAYQGISVHALSVSFKRAVRTVLGPKSRVRLYDLRHSVGADIYRLRGDLATVGRLLGHAPGSRVTAQYARGANAQVDRAAVEALSQARAVQRSPKQSAAQFARQHKTRKRKKMRRVS